MTEGIVIARSSALAAIAEAWIGFSELCESAVEDALLTIVVREAVLLQIMDPGPDITICPQASIAGLPYRLDLLIRVGRQQLAFEVDGLAYHGDQAAFAHDRRRDRALAARRIPTHRFTALEVQKQPEIVARDVRALLLQAYLAEPDEEISDG